jgi:hypothetical protein
MKSDIDRKLFMEDRRQRTRAAFLCSSRAPSTVRQTDSERRRERERESERQRSPSWQFVIFDMLITKFIFTQSKHVHAHIETPNRESDGEKGGRGSARREREQQKMKAKIMALQREEYG